MERKGPCKPGTCSKSQGYSQGPGGPPVDYLQPGQQAENSSRPLSKGPCHPQFCPNKPPSQGFSVKPAANGWSSKSADCGGYTAPSGLPSYGRPQSPPDPEATMDGPTMRTSAGSQLSYFQECSQKVCISNIAGKLLRESKPEPKPQPKRRIGSTSTGGGEVPKPVVMFPSSTKTPAPRAMGRPTSNFGVCRSQDFDEDGDEDETPAEVAAAMLHTEERGVMMRAEPSRTYNTLFQDPDELMIVTTASPNPMQDVVVPAADETLPYTPSRENLTLSASLVAEEEDLPSTSIFTEKMKEMGLYDSMLQSGGIKEEEGGGEEDDDIEAMVDSTSYSSVHETVPPEALEVMLDTALPAHFSRVQLRGSVPPSWFPGYFEALPILPDMTAVTDCPVSVMEDAWEAILHS